jgi:hypothetical protein
MDDQLDRYQVAALLLPSKYSIFHTEPTCGVARKRLAHYPGTPVSPFASQIASNSSLANAHVHAYINHPPFTQF